MVLPLMSCGARLTIYGLLIPAFFPQHWRGPVLWLIYLTGISLAVVAAAVMTLPAWGHHSHGNYIMTEYLNLEGTVTELHWINPHIWIYLEVTDESGESAVWALEAAGADVIAANCSISSRDMLDLASLLKDSTSLPVLCQPNAGKPAVRGGTAVYEETAQQPPTALAPVWMNLRA